MRARHASIVLFFLAPPLSSASSVARYNFQYFWRIFFFTKTDRISSLFRYRAKYEYKRRISSRKVNVLFSLPSAMFGSWMRARRWVKKLIHFYGYQSTTPAVIKMTSSLYACPPIARVDHLDENFLYFFLLLRANLIDTFLARFATALSLRW